MPEKETGYFWDLMDIVPKEVSLVDRGANKKKFALVKSETGGAAMETETELGKGDAAGKALTPPMLKAVIKLTQSAIERLISLASALEGMQKADGDDVEKQAAGQLPANLAAEFKEVITILESILQKYPSAAQKSVKEDATVEGEKAPDNENKVELEKLSKAFEGLAEKLETLSKSVDALQKAETPPETPPAPPAPPAPEVDVEKLKKEIAEAVAEGIKTDLTKALDERAKTLVGLFQEAAKDEFGDVFKKVAEIEKALGAEGEGSGETAGESDAGTDEYTRNYGHEETETDITKENNPFASVFHAMKDF
jgi:hypothetical protein